MIPFSVIFLFVATILLLVLPRAQAIIPILAGILWITIGQATEIMDMHVSVVRLLLLLSLIRIGLKQEWREWTWNGVDSAVVCWGGVMVIMGLFHHTEEQRWVWYVGKSFEALGGYIVFRSFVRTPQDVISACRVLVLLLLPVAVLMIVEKNTARNLFAVFGGVPEESVFRDGKLRAQGPFMHPILAGTVGAALVPYAIFCWREHRRVSVLALFCAVTMVVCSTSSGPIMTALVGALGMAFWKRPRWIRRLCLLAVPLLLCLQLFMQAPVWYLLGRVNLLGSSSGYHRSELITQAIAHFDEWWLRGTDYTRHWMPTGVSWSENHTDITNQFIRCGVDGGLVLMSCFVSIILAAFAALRRVLGQIPMDQFQDRSLLWCLGATLWAHVATFLSVTYWDQSMCLYLMLLAFIASLADYHVHQAPQAESMKALELG